MYSSCTTSLCLFPPPDNLHKLSTYGHPTITKRSVSHIQHKNFLISYKLFANSNSVISFCWIFFQHPTTSVHNYGGLWGGGRMWHKWDANRIARYNPIFDKSNPRFEKSKTEIGSLTQVTLRPLVERLYRCRSWACCISSHVNIMDLGIVSE